MSRDAWYWINKGQKNKNGSQAPPPAASAATVSKCHSHLFKLVMSNRQIDIEAISIPGYRLIGRENNNNL